jgi:hypothetical protein
MCVGIGRNVDEREEISWNTLEKRRHTVDYKNDATSQYLSSGQEEGQVLLYHEQHALLLYECLCTAM